MATESDKIFNRLSALNVSLDDLEAQLEPLLAQTLPETIVGLETMQQAKLQVALPYLVYDLVFIYLRTRGIDPKTHPIIGELDRIKQYFDKIKNAEDPEKRKTAVDKQAANRFIKHAIMQVKAQRPPGDAQGPSHIKFDENGNAPVPVPVPVKVTSKMLARAEYQKELKELGSEEESDLEVFEEVEQPVAAKGKGKAREIEPSAADTPEVATSRKRRRPAIDPFTGYRDESREDVNSAQDNKSATEDVMMMDNLSRADSGRSTPVSAEDLAAKREKRAAKKARKKTKRESTS